MGAPGGPAAAPTRAAPTEAPAATGLACATRCRTITGYVVASLHWQSLLLSLSSRCRRVLHNKVAPPPPAPFPSRFRLLLCHVRPDQSPAQPPNPPRTSCPPPQPRIAFAAAAATAGDPAFPVQHLRGCSGKWLHPPPLLAPHFQQWSHLQPWQWPWCWCKGPGGFSACGGEFFVCNMYLHFQIHYLDNENFFA